MKDAIQRFKVAAAAYDAANALHEDSRIDVLLAERGRGDKTVEEAKRDHSRSTSERWHPAYIERKEAATALLAALDLTPNQIEHFKGALR